MKELVNIRNDVVGSLLRPPQAQTGARGIRRGKTES